MTAEEWENAARNSWITQIGRNNAPYVRRSYVPNNGYSTAPPQYNSYWSQRQNPYRRTDYTQPIQTSQTPPINQALNENFQPQYIQTTDYNGRPIIYPANAASQGVEYLKNGLAWGAGQLAENALLRNITGKSLGDWAAIGARRFAPKVAGAIVGGPIGAAIPWVPEAVRGAEYLLSTPTAKTLGNGIKTLINWGL